MLRDIASGFAIKEPNILYMYIYCTNQIVARRLMADAATAACATR